MNKNIPNAKVLRADMIPKILGPTCCVVAMFTIENFALMLHFNVMGQRAFVPGTKRCVKEYG